MKQRVVHQRLLEVPPPAALGGLWWGVGGGVAHILKPCDYIVLVRGLSFVAPEISFPLSFYSIEVWNTLQV